MYCKKCKYYAHDHISTCPKCGANWEDTRKELHLNWLTKASYNWLAPSTSAVSDEHRLATGIAAGAGASAVHNDIDFSEVAVPKAPTPQARPDDDLDVSMLPELDLNLMDETPAPEHKPMAEETVSIMPELEVPELDLNQDMILSAPSENITAQTPAAPTMEELSLSDDVLELDFSTADATPVQAPPKAPKKKEDLFIPELEEMLAPLTEDQKPSAQNKKISFSEDDDILLDFNMDNNK